MKSSSQMLNDMIILATIKHAGQVDKGGYAYILHPLTVMLSLGSEVDDEVRAIAVGHDLIEDTEVTLAQLKVFGFSDRIIDGIKALTKVQGQSYAEYKESVKRNKDAILVKIADLTHNMDMRRLKGITTKDATRLKQYQVFHNELIALI